MKSHKRIHEPDWSDPRQENDNPEHMYEKYCISSAMDNLKVEMATLNGKGR